VALKLTTLAARHPRRARRAVRLANAGASVAPVADRVSLAEMLTSLRAAGVAYRRATVKARRRARLRKLAVGASVVGVAAYAERMRRAAA
jgi:hypothetical protein